MKTTHDSQYRGNLVVAVVIAALASFLAFPSLVEAWRTDLYARGGPAAFAIWILTHIVVFILNRNQSRHPARWTTIAALTCAAGSVADLRVLLHAGLALAFTGLAGFRFTGLASAVAALSWMPAAGWFISRLRAGGLDGWERPLVATAFAVVIITAVRIRNSQRS
ncbi:MAG: hypothetical protein ACQCXQ_02335 [Verrucomicrobiales bacterium]|nr:hypothetical protein [Verrucomicrobiota bacterium JB025]